MLQNRGLGYLASILGIAAVTAICVLLRSHINEMTVALAMLLVVLFIAMAWGRWPGLVASVLGMLCLNFFFLPPIYTFTIADPKNWTALTAFFIAALTAGQLSTWVKQRAAEAEASRSQARLASTYNRSLLEASLDPLVTIGHDGKINDVNTAAETITGHSRAELIGTDFSEYFREPEKARAAYEQVFRGDVVRGCALELRHRNGHSTSVLYDGSLYRDASGNVIGVVATTRPISTYAGKPLVAQPDPRVVRHLGLFVGFASLFSVAVGLLSLVGLTFGIAVLKSTIPGQPVIKFNAAVCLLLLGVSLWLLRQHNGRPFPRTWKVCGQLMAAITALLGLLSLAEHLAGWDLGIDQLLFREPAADAFVSVRPGLMASITALDFLLLGLALLLVDRGISWRSRRHWPAQYFASLTAILSILGLLDFILGSHISYTHMALQTAVTLLMLSLGLLCTRTERGLAALLASSMAGGVLTRRLLPAAVIIPIVIGALGWRAFSAGLYSGWSVVSLMIIATMTLLAGLAIWNGYIINRGDVERLRAEGILYQREMELREAQRLAQVGSWWWAPRTDSVTWSAGLSYIAWRDPMLPPSTYKEHLGFYTTQSSARLDAAIQSAIQTGVPYELDLEMVRANGAIRSVTGRGEVERDADGQIVLVRGTVQDVTELKRAEREIQLLAREAKLANSYNRSLIEASLDPLVTIGHDGKITDVNAATETATGRSRAELIGTDFSDYFTEPEQARAGYQQAFRQGLVRNYPLEVRHGDGHTIPVLYNASVYRDEAGGIVGVFAAARDVTERRRAENEIRLLAHLQAVVAELGQEALRNETSGQVLDDAVALVAQTLDIEYCKVLELLPDGKALLLRSGVGWKQGLVGHGTVGAGTDSQAGYTLLSDQPVIVEDLRTERRFSGSPLLHEHGVVSGMSVIISTSEGPYGVLGAHTRKRRSFSKDEVNFLKAVANVLGMMIERQRADDALRESEENLNRAQRIAHIGSWHLDAVRNHLTWSDEVFRIFGVAKGTSLTYEAFLETVHPEDREAVNKAWTAALHGARYDIELRIIVGDEVKWVRERAKVEFAKDGNAIEGLGTVQDITERRRAEAEIRALNAGLEQRVIARTTQLQAANRELQQAREREIEIGFRIQQTLLLDQPPVNVPGLRVAALTIPSQRIDGDFYIFLRHSDESLDVIVGDVMGKGVPAALLGAATKSHFLRALNDLMVLSKDGKLPEPKDIVMLAHAELVRHLIDLDSFVTLCYARFNMSKCSLDLVDCGHTGIVHLHGKNGLHEILHGDNLPLGIREGEIYDQISVPFEPGDLFFFYSDGVTEARSPTGELFGPQRLEECVVSNGQLEPAPLVDAVRQAVATFTGSGQLTDDLTSVAIRVQAEQLPVARQELEIGSDLKQLRQAREFVRAFCRNVPGPPMDEDSVAALELAVNEAASNIMKHAYHGREDQSIHIEAEAFPGRLAIQLHHFGDAFDPSTAPPPPLDGSRDSGYGAYIIARSVDEVRYYRDERGRNCIALVKARKTGGK